jgi:N-acetylneuraminic acid mutarotase
MLKRKIAALFVAIGSVAVVRGDELKYPDLPAAFSSFGAAVAGDYVYVYGGHTGKAHSYSVETTQGEFRRIHLKKPEKWEELTGGPKLQGLALVAHKGKLYRVGGMQPQNSKTEKNDIRSQSTCAIYDPATTKWTDIEPLPEARSSHDAAVLGDTLYVFGGWTLKGTGKGEWIEHGLSLDLSSPGAKWEKVKQPFQRRALTVATFENKIYVICGLSAAGKTEKVVNVFDPKSGTWSEGPAVPGQDMNGFTPASAVQGGRLYLTPTDGKVYRLNEKKDAWEEAGKLEKSRFVARMVAGPANSLVVLAGAAPGGMLASVENIQPSK